MILFKCQCGACCRAEDSQAGSDIVCPSCGAQAAVPAESQDGVVLIYVAGAPDEGIVVTLQELAEGIAAGRYTDIDLIWQDGAWKALGDVYEVPSGTDGHSAGEDAYEIALTYSELAPAPGFPPLGKSLPGSVNLPGVARKKRRLLTMLLGVAVLIICGIAAWQVIRYLKMNF